MWKLRSWRLAHVIPHCFTGHGKCERCGSLNMGNIDYFAFVSQWDITLFRLAISILCNMHKKDMIRILKFKELRLRGDFTNESHWVLYTVNPKWPINLYRARKYNKNQNLLVRCRILFRGGGASWRSRGRWSLRFMVRGRFISGATRGLRLWSLALNKNISLKIFFDKIPPFPFFKTFQIEI